MSFPLALRGGSLADAGGSGTFVFDEIAVAVEMTRAQYEATRVPYLQHRGFLPRPRPALPAHGLRPAWPAVTDADILRMGYAWQGPYPTLTTLDADGQRVLEDPGGRILFTPDVLDGVYGQEANFRWRDDLPGGPGCSLPVPGMASDGSRLSGLGLVIHQAVEPLYRYHPEVADAASCARAGGRFGATDGAPRHALVPYPHAYFPADFFDGAPLVDLTLWKDDNQIAQRFAVILVERIGESAGDRHDVRLLRNHEGVELGWLGWYETGGSGNEFNSGFGRFLAREVAAGIVEVVVNIVGNVVAPGAGSAFASEAGSLVSTALTDAAGSAGGSAASDIVGRVSDAVPSSVTDGLSNVTGVTVAATLEVVNQVDPAAVENVFATIAILTTYFAGLDDLLLGLGSLFRLMAIHLQSDPKALARELAADEASVARFGGKILTVAIALAKMASQVIVSVATAGAAAPYLAAVRALEGVAAAAESGDPSALAAAGAALLKAAAAFVPVAGPALAQIAGAAQLAAKGDASHAGAAMGEMVAAMIPEVGSALAAAGGAVLAVADAQDTMRRADLAQERGRVARAQAVNRFRNNADTVTVAASATNRPAALAAAASDAEAALSRGELIREGFAALARTGGHFRALPTRERVAWHLAAALGLGALGETMRGRG